MPGRRNSVFKGPVVEGSLTTMRDEQKVLGAGVERPGGSMEDEENTEVWGPSIPPTAAASFLDLWENWKRICKEGRGSPLFCHHLQLTITISSGRSGGGQVTSLGCIATSRQGRDSVSGLLSACTVTGQAARHTHASLPGPGRPAPRAEGSLASEAWHGNHLI